MTSTGETQAPRADGDTQESSDAPSEASPSEASPDSVQVLDSGAEPAHADGPETVPFVQQLRSFIETVVGDDAGEAPSADAPSTNADASSESGAGAATGGEAEPFLDALFDGLSDWLIEFAKQNSYVLGLAIFSLIRATGITVRSGTTGLLFSFGRARAIVEPGFRMLLPFLQIVRAVPTRHRTLDLPSQRVTTLDGLVYFVDANVVYRIVDVKKALIEIDQLLAGMRQMLVLSVQEVLRRSDRRSFRTSTDLDSQLARAMERRVAPWGVEVQHAGFTSITPSPKTLRLTQLASRVETRARGLADLVPDLTPGLGVAMLGTNQRLIRRTRLQREREITRRRRRRVDRIFRAALLPLTSPVSARTRANLRRRLLVDAGFAGVFGDAGLGDDAPATDPDVPLPTEASGWAAIKRGGRGLNPTQVRKRRKRSPKRGPSSPGARTSNPTRVRHSPTGRTTAGA